MTEQRYFLVEISHIGTHIGDGIRIDRLTEIPEVHYKEQKRMTHYYEAEIDVGSGRLEGLIEEVLDLEFPVTRIKIDYLLKR